jgi:hypothetical protein
MGDRIEMIALREYLKYIGSDEAKEKTTETLTNQIKEFLNIKYPHSTITVDIEEGKGTFKIEGGSEEEQMLILMDLEAMGVL